MPTRTEVALSRLNNQFNDSENLRDVITAMFTGIEDTEGLLDYLENNRHLEDAEGVWLDNVGEIVGVERPLEEIDDDDYFEFGEDEGLPEARSVATTGAILTAGNRYSLGHDTSSYSYFFPQRTGTKTIKYDKVAETWSEISIAVSGHVTIGMFKGITTGSDGKIYLAPAGALAFYRFDPTTETMEALGGAPGTTVRYSSAVAVGDKIYYIPNDNEYFACYDISTDTLDTSVGASLGTGTDKVYAQDAAKLYNSRYIYVVPNVLASYDYFIKFDTTTDTWSTVGAQYTEAVTQGFCAVVEYDDVMYAIPVQATKFVAIDTVADTWASVGADLSTVAPFSFASGAFVYDDKIVTVPGGADAFSKFDPATDTWVLFGDLTKPSPGISFYVKEGSRIASPSTTYDEIWEMDLDTGVSAFTALTAASYGQPQGSVSSMVIPPVDGVYRYLQKYSSLAEYPNGFSNTDQLYGGQLRSLTGTWLDGTTYISDDDYFVLITAKAASSFVGSTLHSVAQYIYDAFGVTCFVGIDASLGGDWYVELDEYLETKKRRYLVLYAPVPVGSTITISNWPSS